MRLLPPIIKCTVWRHADSAFSGFYKIGSYSSQYGNCVILRCVHPNGIKRISSSFSAVGTGLTGTSSAVPFFIFQSFTLLALAFSTTGGRSLENG